MRYTLAGCSRMRVGKGSSERKEIEKMIKIGGFEVEIACRSFPAEVFLESPYDPKGLALKR